MNAQMLEDRRAACWARRRWWTKTDTARWITDRADQVRPAVDYCTNAKELGYYMRVHRLPIFDKLHQRLAAMENDEMRNQAVVEEVMR